MDKKNVLYVYVSKNKKYKKGAMRKNKKYKKGGMRKIASSQNKLKGLMGGPLSHKDMRKMKRGGSSCLPAF